MAQLEEDVGSLVRQTGVSATEGKDPSDSSQASNDVRLGNSSVDRGKRRNSR